jgi:hypothetical protein
MEMPISPGATNAPFTTGALGSSVVAAEEPELAPVPGSGPPPPLVSPLVAHAASTPVTRINAHRMPNEATRAKRADRIAPSYTARMRARLPIAALILLAACDTKRAGPPPSASVTASGAPSSSAAPPPVPASRFAVVAEGSFDLRKDGAALYAVTSGLPGLVIALEPSGAVSPLQQLALERINEVGVVTTSPRGAMLVENVMWFDSASARSAMFEVTELSARAITSNERYTAFQAWKDGAKIAIRSDAPTPKVTTFPTLVLHKASFEAQDAKGAKVKSPAIPAGLAHADDFAAYPSGRLLLLAGPKPKEMPGESPAAALHDYGPKGDDAPKPIALPGDPDLGVTHLDRGRSEDELLVYTTGTYGRTAPYLAKLDAAHAKAIAIETGLDMPILSLSRGEDGSLWIVTGYFVGGEGFKFGKLYSAKIAGERATLTPVPLPSCASIPKLKKLSGACSELTPLGVVARNERDVWVIATLGASTTDNVLLHTQAPPASVATVDVEQVQREAWATTPAPPFKTGCETPVVVLGEDAPDMESRVAAAVRETAVAPAPEAARARLGGKDVWVVELTWDLAETKYKTPAGALALFKKTFTGAALVCARPLLKKTLPFPRDGG